MKKKILKNGLAGLMAAVMLLGTAGNAVFADSISGKKIFSSEFDGTDDAATKATWAKYNASYEYVSPYSGTPADGMMHADASKTGNGAFGIHFEKAIAVSGKKIIIETKFKCGEKTRVSKTFFTIDRVGDGIPSLRIGTNQGNLACSTSSKQDPTTLEGDEAYAVLPNVWYELVCEIDYTGDNPAVSFVITAENGEPHKVTGKSCMYNQAKDIEGIEFGQTAPNGDGEPYNWYIDYVRVYEDSFSVSETSIADKKTGVAADTDYTLTFSGDVKAETVKNSDGYSLITVTDSQKNAVPAKAEVTGGNKVQLYFPAGLRYNETYTVKIPNTVASASGSKAVAAEYTFTTEEEPFVVGTPSVSVANNEATASVKVKNNTSAARDIHIITAVYSDGVLVKLVSEKITVPKGTNGKISATALDVTGIKNIDTKAYVWSGTVAE